MWTPTTRQQHSRIVTRYQTDLTDAESSANLVTVPRRLAGEQRVRVLEPAKRLAATRPRLRDPPTNHRCSLIHVKAAANTRPIFMRAQAGQQFEHDRLREVFMAKPLSDKELALMDA